jgi:hypothetical protein
MAGKAAIAYSVYMLSIDRYLYGFRDGLDVGYLGGYHNLHGIILGNVLTDLRQA